MRPTLHLYCQHSIGMGHFVRSLALARELATQFHVIFLNGNRRPEGIDLPSNVRFVHLPPIAMNAEFQLVSNDDARDLESAKQERIEIMRSLATESPPNVVLVELYPFGRKKFAFEIEPLLEAARKAGAISVCSVRDLLIASRDNQQRHDDRAAAKLNEAFDLIIVHADPVFARLEETFRPSIPLNVRIHYSGFVTPHQQQAADTGREKRVMVSAGGGIVGSPLFRAALAAQKLIHARERWPMTLVAGPFLPEDEWRYLLDAAHDTPALTLHRSVPNLARMLRSVTHSVSQCGYNTALDVLASGASALVIPYAERGEDEQRTRAERLSALGLLDWLHSEDVTPELLAEKIMTLQPNRNSRAPFRMDGAAETTRIIQDYLSRHPGKAAVLGRL